MQLQTTAEERNKAKRAKKEKKTRRKERLENIYIYIIFTPSKREQETPNCRALFVQL